MKTILSLLFLLIMPFSLWSQVKVAMVISGHASQGDASLSYDLEELAQSYLILNDNGIKVDIISPNGGAVMVHDKKDHLPHINRFKALAGQALTNTYSAQKALAEEYQGLVIIGGDGAVFDLPIHPQTQQLITNFVDNQLPIAAVCHGPAALLNIKLDNGRYFVSNKRISSFTRIEDHAFKKEHLDKYPFILQTKLEDRGAIFTSNSPMLPFVEIDNNLITAQNPMSVPKAIEALILKLNLTPKKRDLYKDELTFELVAQARQQGPVLIDIALSKSLTDYDLTYLALYGFYAYQLAENAEDKLLQLRIMEQIAKHFSHPQFYVALISAYKEHGFTEKAARHQQLLTGKYPDFTLPETSTKAK